MSEHLRANGYQWCDAELYMVIDVYKGAERIGGFGGKYYGTKEEALAHVQAMRAWESRLLIIRVDAIAAYALEPRASCGCTMTQKLVGDGCEVCNPAKAAEYSEDS